MKEKCTKYETLFVFRDKQELDEHIKNCPDCAEDQEKMDKVSELIQEVRPYYMQKRKNSFNTMKVACVVSLGLFVGAILGYVVQYAYPTTDTSTTTVSTTQSTNDYGAPIDSYGLITVN